MDKPEKIKNKSGTTIPIGTTTTKVYHKVPDDVFNAVNQLLLTVTCKLSDGLKVLTAFQKSEIISE